MVWGMISVKVMPLAYASSTLTLTLIVYIPIPNPNPQLGHASSSCVLLPCTGTEWDWDLEGGVTGTDATASTHVRGGDVPAPMYLHLRTCAYVPAPMYMRLCTCAYVPAPMYLQASPRPMNVASVVPLVWAMRSLSSTVSLGHA